MGVSSVLTFACTGLKLSQTWSKEKPSPPSFSQIRSGEGITPNITLPRFSRNAKYEPYNLTYFFFWRICQSLKLFAELPNILFHRFFLVIIIRYSVDYTGEVNSLDIFTPKDLMTYEEAHKSPVPAAYVTFQFRRQDFDAFREFVVGDGGHPSSKTRNKRSCDGEVFLNKPLKPNTNYRMFISAFIEKVKWQTSSFENANL